MGYKHIHIWDMYHSHVRVYIISMIISHMCGCMIWIILDYYPFYGFSMDYWGLWIGFWIGLLGIIMDYGLDYVTITYPMTDRWCWYIR